MRPTDFGAAEVEGLEERVDVGKHGRVGSKVRDGDKGEGGDEELMKEAMRRKRSDERETRSGQFKRLGPTDLWDFVPRALMSCSLLNGPETSPLPRSRRNRAGVKKEPGRHGMNEASETQP